MPPPRRLQRNDAFFQAGAAAAATEANPEKRYAQAFRRCAETGVLNLSNQSMAGDLPPCVLSYHESQHSENWWDQNPIRKLDISNNALTRIPPEIGKFRNCEAFVARGNELAVLAEELLTELPLKTLDVTKNNLGALPAGASALVELLAAENRLTALPADLFDLQSLITLDVSGNRIKAWPSGDWGCTKLMKINLSGNGSIRALPRGLRCCSELRELRAAGIGLETHYDLFEVPPGHGWQSSLLVLDLARNQLRKLVLSNLDVLDDLNVGDNRLTVLDLQGSFPRLSRVIAEGNQLSVFPPGLLPATAPRLNLLDLANNVMDEVPPELGRNENLKHLTLSGNPLRSIRPELLRGSTEELMRFLRSRIVGGVDAQEMAEAADRDVAVMLRNAKASHELVMVGKGIRTLPTLPWGLQVLRVHGNVISSHALLSAFETAAEAVEGTDMDEEQLPPHATLRHLGASGNPIGEPARGSGCVLLEIVRMLPILEELDLGFCELRLPGSVDDWACDGRSRRLRVVNLSGNGLRTLPCGLLASSPDLHELRLRRCGIRSIDALPMEHPRLATLDLEENQLGEGPPWLPSMLPQLRTLLLSNNGLLNLPPEWGFWESLQNVSLAGNPLKSLPQSLLAQGWAAVALRLRDRLKAGASRLVPMPGAAPEEAGPGPAAGDALVSSDPALRAPCRVLSRCSTRSGSPASSWGGTADGGPGPRRASQPAVRAVSCGQLPPTVPGSRGGTPLPSSEQPPGAGSRPPSAVANGFSPVTPRLNAGLEQQLANLRKEVASLQDRMDTPGLSKTALETLKHTSRLKRAALRKAERQLASAEEMGR